MCKVKSTFELMMAFRFCLTLLFTATAQMRTLMCMLSIFMSDSPKRSSKDPLIMVIKVHAMNEIFQLQQLQDLRLHVNVAPLISLCFLHLADAFNAADETSTFDLNYALEEEMLDGSNDPEHVEQGQNNISTCSSFSCNHIMNLKSK